MTNKIRNPNALSIVMAVAVLSSLAACGAEQKPPPPVEDTAFRDMAGAMDKARAVEGTMQEHKEALDKALEEKENPTAQ